MVDKRNKKIRWKLSSQGVKIEDNLNFENNTCKIKVFEKDFIYSTRVPTNGHQDR